MKKAGLACLLLACGARTQLRGEGLGDGDASTSSDSADAAGNKDSGPPSPCIATAPTLLASGGKEIQFIALDHDDVYWTDFESGDVAAVSKAGGGQRDIAPGRSNPSGLVIVGPTIYWTEFGAGNVMSGAASGGGEFTTIASKQDGAFDITAASGAIFWTTVQSCSVAESADGGKAHVLVHAKQPFTAITSTDDHVFWVSIEDKIIARYDIGTGNISTLLSVDALDLPSTLATDGKNVYFGGTSGTELVVSAIPIVGGDPVTLHSEACVDAGGSRCIGDVATDGDFVYFTSKTGTVRKVSTSGGDATTIASGQARPFAVTVDDRCVYWSNLDDGTVWAAPKK
jgi:hypothetical protein